MNYTNTDYRKRIANVKYANSVVKSCLRRMHIHDYIPGQVIYNLGEYPNKMTIRPTAYDHDLIRKLSENGVGLIQIHEEWNDAMRIMGADKFSSHDKDGLKEFIDLCHSFHIKVLPYLSSGFFDERDPDFTEKFVSGSKLMLVQNYYRYRCCNAASPEWNQYLFDNLHRMMDEYAFDGIFNDMGYDRRDGEGNPYGMEEYDPYIEDLLVRMYSVVKNEYHGIVKLHIGELQLPVSNEKIYDYLWVGESCKTSEELLRTVQYSPYVIPCPDYKFTNETNGDTQLFLVGAVTGACLDSINFFRSLFFSIDKKWAKSNWWLALFILLLLAAGIATWQNAYSILPMIGSLLSTVALWMKTSKKIRLISFFSGPCWLIYNVVNGAYSAAVNELIAMTSIVIGILRHDIKKKQCG